MQKQTGGVERNSGEVQKILPNKKLDETQVEKRLSSKENTTKEKQ